MNAQISDFSAAYGSRSVSPRMQQGMGQAQQPSPLLSSMEAGGLTGVQQGAAAAQQMQGGAGLAGLSMPITDLNQPQAISSESVQYLNGFLRTQIGNRLRVEFLVGTNTYLEKSGKLLAVGTNYIILQESMSDDLLVCDFFNIKFVTIFR